MKGTQSFDNYVAEQLLGKPGFAEGYLRAAFEAIDEDQGEEAFLMALRQVVEARGGMTEIARKAGLSRESLYRALSARGNPTLRTLHAVIRAAGLRFADIARAA